MHVISRKKLKEAAAQHGNLEVALDVWFRVAKKADWKSLQEVRQIFPSADQVEGYTVFNIKGNACRLITRILYRYGRVYVRHVLTHAEYDKGDWKK